MKKKDEHPMMAQDSLCKYMYDIFVKKEYSYLHLLTGKVKLDQLPLPMCFETSVKQAFPNPEGRPYTGFHQSNTCIEKKQFPLVNSIKNYLALVVYIYIYVVLCSILKNGNSFVRFLFIFFLVLKLV